MVGRPRLICLDLLGCHKREMCQQSYLKPTIVILLHDILISYDVSSLGVNDLGVFIGVI